MRTHALQPLVAGRAAPATATQRLWRRTALDGECGRPLSLALLSLCEAGMRERRSTFLLIMMMLLEEARRAETGIPFTPSTNSKDKPPATSGQLLPFAAYSLASRRGS